METMNVKRFSETELEAVSAQVADALAAECSSVYKTRERMSYLGALLFEVQLERQTRREDPWANEDTFIELTDTDLAIAYAEATR